MTIIKILSRHSPSYKGLINYILKEQKEKPYIITHNIHDQDPLKATQEYIENEANRAVTRSDQVYLYHEIISFSNLDSKNINDEVMEDLGRKYIELRGKEGVYYGAVHKDRDHPHLHFCVSGTKTYSGKAMRLARDNLRELKIKFEEYQKLKYPELNNSLCEHGKAKPYQQNKEYFKNKRATMKTEIEKKVQEILDLALTQKMFLDELRANDLNHYERKNGEPTGIVYENTKFRFSSLDMDMEKFKALPIDQEEDKKVLKEIEELRNRFEETNKDRTLRFEEYGNEKIITYNNEVKQTSWIDSNGNKYGNEEEITADEKYEFDRMYEIIEEYENQSTKNVLSEMSEEELQEFQNANSVMDEYPDRFEPDEFEQDQETETDLSVFDLDDDELEDEPETENESEIEDESEMEESEEEMSRDNDDDYER